MIKTKLTHKLKAIASAFVLTLLTSCDTGTIVQAGEGFPGEQWQEKAPEEVGLDAHKLEANFKNFKGPLVVVKDGNLIYAKGDISEPIHIYSIGKSLTALVFATLLQPEKVDYDDLLPGSDVPSQPQATFRHFMTMTSDYGLTPHEPGKHYAYNNNAIEFYGNYLAINFFQTKSPRKVLQKAIWKHIGRQDPVTFEGQWGGWGGGFAISTRDLARIGHLVLNQGNWNGTQILPTSFVKDLYSNQIPEEATANYDRGPNDMSNQHHITKELQGNYSFGWWIAHKTHPSIQTKAINGVGYRGKELIVSPEHNLVIVGLPQQKNAPNAADYFNAVIGAAIDTSPQLIKTSP
ncbi:MAG: serine hydrolase domain-containing protein [Xenococcaceae cyanobacterium]